MCSLLPVRIALSSADASPPYTAAHTRTAPLAYLLTQALLPLLGSDAAPLPSLVAHVQDAPGSGAHVSLPLALPLGPCFDALHDPSSAAALPFRLAVPPGAAPGLPGCSGGMGAVLEAFTSSLRSATLLSLAAAPGAAEAAAHAALPLQRIRDALAEALHGGGGGGSGGGGGGARPRAAAAGAPASALVPLRILLRAAAGGASGGEALVVVQEGAPASASLREAVRGALQRARGYVREAGEVVLVEQGEDASSAAGGTHAASVGGVAVSGVEGMWGACVGEVQGAAGAQDGWLYVSLRRAGGFGRHSL